MTSRLAHLPLALAFCLVSVAASAQAIDQTGTGGGPLSTQRAPNTTSVGRTKPPSRDASPTSTGSLERRTAQEREDDSIDTGICIGCNAK